MQEWIEKKVLIWGKTYPELSSKYYETVCTGGVTEDGDFIRLYPIPFRYLKDQQSFAKYQWLKLRIKKSKDDPRPESFKVDPESIEIIDTIPSDPRGWAARRNIVFKKQDRCYRSVEQLFAENKLKKVSMGFVKPAKILDVYVEERSKEEEAKFMEKLDKNREKSKQTSMFGLSVEEVKALDFVSNRFKVHWSCDDPNCQGHKMSILDWEAYELARREGTEKTLLKLKSVLNTSKHDVGFFLGNFRLYPTSFTIGGIWYPKKAAPQEPTLFDNL